jgi:insertion element IS1 protein InsB
MVKYFQKRIKEQGHDLYCKKHQCPHCDSFDIVKNGHDGKGNQKYACHNCLAYGTLEPTQSYSEARKDEILRAYQERSSMRGISRIFGVARQTLANWLKQQADSLPKLADTLVPVQADDVLELDELWSFVFSKDQQQWIWIALCRRTRQIVAFFIGDRSEASCQELWKQIPKSYQACHTYSDFWQAYEAVFKTGKSCKSC